MVYHQLDCDNFSQTEDSGILSCNLRNKSTNLFCVVLTIYFFSYK